jgi:hypothetical protein
MTESYIECHRIVSGHPQEDVVFHSDGPTRAVDFDFESIYRNDEDEEQPEKTVSWSDLAASVSIILAWIQGKKKRSDVRSVAARALGLMYLLDQGGSHYNSLQEIADATGLTRAGVSAFLVKLRDEIGLTITGGIPQYARAIQQSCKSIDRTWNAF